MKKSSPFVTPLDPHPPAGLSEEGSTGILCGLCRDGYAYSSSAQRCDECDSGESRATQSIMVGLMGLMLSFIVSYWLGWVDVLIPPDTKIRRKLRYLNMGTVSHDEVVLLSMSHCANVHVPRPSRVIPCSP